MPIFSLAAGGNIRFGRGPGGGGGGGGVSLAAGFNWGNHALASGGGASRRSGVRRRNGRCGGSSGGASAAAKISGLGHDDKRPAEALETTRSEVTPEPRLRWRPGYCVRTHFSLLRRESRISQQCEREK